MNFFKQTQTQLSNMFNGDESVSEIMADFQKKIERLENVRSNQLNKAAKESQLITEASERRQNALKEADLALSVAQKMKNFFNNENSEGEV